MLRMLVVFCALTVLEVLVAGTVGQAPSARPFWYATAQSTAALLMCVGGVEAARWLLRRSPAVSAPGPRSDWSRLWLWTGVPGGLFLVVGLLLTWAVAPYLGPKASLLLMGHFVTGAMVWLAVSFWPIRDVLTSPSPEPLPRLLMLTGLGLHGLGVILYCWVYPALLRGPWKVDLGLLFSLVSHYYFVFYYILLAGLAWSVAFRWWTPPVAVELPLDASHDSSTAPDGD